MKKEVLFRVNAGGEAGSGHLMRCLVLARMLKKDYDPYFLVKGDNKIGEILYKENFNFKLAMHGFDEEIRDIKGLRPNLIVLDLRETPIDFVRTIKAFAPVLDIDDAGPGALAANVSLYSLPVLEDVQANYQSLDYLVFDPAIHKHNKSRYSGKIKNILVSFGGSDPADLSSVMIRISKLADPELEWTFIRGHFNRHNWPEGRYTALENKKNIYPEIEKADLFVTSFGMAAYEAVAIGTPVILFNPGEYHEKLGQRAELFASLGVYDNSGEEDNTPELATRFRTFLEQPDSLVSSAKESQQKVDKKGAERLYRFITRMVNRGRVEPCRVCGERQETSLYRDKKRNIFHCENCDLLWQDYFQPPDFAYESDYFNEQYEAQYGKSYQEDRLNIDRLNKPRLAEIEKHYEKSVKKFGFKEKNLLEIGSAYGFFLDLARDGDWSVAGIEVSKAAVDFARRNLSLDINQESILESDIPADSCHVVAMWYVIEHIPELERVMEKIYQGLKQGGLFALSTPNSRGYTGRFRPDAYIKNHPEDHFFDFSIPCMKQLLKRYNFQVLSVRVTGIHFERFLADRKNPDFWDNGFVRWLYERIARIFKLGDTFEIYARKK